MIAKITGVLEEVAEQSAMIEVGGLWYEVLIPACDLERLRRRVGDEVSLHTIHYVEGDPSHGAQTPRLIGFMEAGHRRFFQKFTTVKGIGVRKALRTLARPVEEIAAAIQGKDTKLLIALPEIGRRTAEQIVASLHDQVDEFAGAPAAAEQGPATSDAAREALSVLVQLGEKRYDAQALIERVLAVAPEADSAEDIIQAAYKLRSGG